MRHCAELTAPSSAMRQVGWSGKALNGRSMLADGLDEVEGVAEVAIVQPATVARPHRQAHGNVRQLRLRERAAQAVCANGRGGLGQRERAQPSGAGDAALHHQDGVWLRALGCPLERACVVAEGGRPLDERFIRGQRARRVIPGWRRWSTRPACTRPWC